MHPDMDFYTHGYMDALLAHTLPAFRAQEECGCCRDSYSLPGSKYLDVGVRVQTSGGHAVLVRTMSYFVLLWSLKDRVSVCEGQVVQVFGLR